MIDGNESAAEPGDEREDGGHVVAHELPAGVDPSPHGVEFRLDLATHLRSGVDEHHVDPGLLQGGCRGEAGEACAHHGHDIAA